MRAIDGATAALLTALLSLVAVATALPSSRADVSTCGYDACPRPVPGRVNAHLVPHTHDDVGWLRTVDQYYYYEVQFIIDTVVQSLLENPERKFTYVEMAFFYRWWRQQTPQRQQQVKRLVQTGQLQFALGGWCMDDEASTHYVDIVDQHTEGLRFLNETFGDCGRPRVAWQVDPFGHSKEHSALLALMGFDGLFYGRIDYQDEGKRMRERTMEMVWQASQDIGSPQADLFSGKLYGGYCSPPGFTYENGDEPVQDDPRLYDYNVERKVQEFLDMVHSRARVFSSDHVMLTMGCDFQYQNADKNFKIYDKLIKAVNARSSQHNVTVYYSTPSCYTKSVNEQNLVWTTKTDDFFPYAHTGHAFWTGYFTSRAALKRYVRQTSNIFQVIKQLVSLSGLQRHTDARAQLDRLRQAMGVVQHHDGVSGTEKQAVTYDYALRMAAGLNSALPALTNAWAAVTNDASLTSMAFCPLVNISSCPFTDANENFHLLIHNPVSHPVWQLLRIPVLSRFYVVSDERGRLVPSQTVPLNAGTMRVPERAGARSNFELVFNVTSIPAMGFVVYKVAACSPSQTGASTFTPIVTSNSRSPWIRLRPDLAAAANNSGASERKRSTPNTKEFVTNDRGRVSTGFYFGFQGNNSKPEFIASGAYLFRPTKQTPEMFSSEWLGSVTGPVVNESHTSWSDWSYQVRRSFGSSDPLSFEEVEFTVGPIPFSDKQGREVIARYDTRVQSASVFFTDANGRQILRRVRDFRPTWQLQQTENVSGNYYPINSQIFINDSTSSFTVLTDRSEGGGSINDGQIEVMLHRITIDDDSLGVGEPLQELGIDRKGLVVKATHWIFADASPNAAAKRRELANRKFREPVVGFLAAEPKVKSWSGLRTSLPDNLQVVTLDDWTGADVKLLRLEHLFQAYEDSRLSKPVTVDLARLFAAFDIVEAVELTLAANQQAASASRLTWRTEDESHTQRTNVPIVGTQVTLAPMQIRTFQVRVKYL